MRKQLAIMGALITGGISIASMSGMQAAEAMRSAVRINHSYF
jgi:hypothetical protein